jgi:hypothetical protein
MRAPQSMNFGRRRGLNVCGQGPQQPWATDQET